MTINEAMLVRHSVRSYTDKPVSGEEAVALGRLIDECNRESVLHIQLVLNEPRAFDSLMAHYGKFSGVKNYVALIGKKQDGTDEKIGYYGEKIALYAQTIGLNTCWVAMTYKKVKTAFSVEKGEKLYCVLALGYGATQGAAHKSKAAAEVCSAENAPEWFIRGAEAALLAPTAMNQQKFFFKLDKLCGVSASTKKGFYSRIDLGIAKYHFEVGAGKENFKWN